MGSLMLGVYDTLKLILKNVSFAFNAINLRDRTMSLNSTEIVPGTGERIIIPSISLPMFPDSTVPFIQLPCRRELAIRTSVWYQLERNGAYIPDQRH